MSLVGTVRACLGSVALSEKRQKDIVLRANAAFALRPLTRSRNKSLASARLAVGRIYLDFPEECFQPFRSTGPLQCTPKLGFIYCNRKGTARALSAKNSATRLEQVYCQGIIRPLVRVRAEVGQEYPALLENEALEELEGEIIGPINATDITRRKEAEAEFEASRLPSSLGYDPPTRCRHTVPRRRGEQKANVLRSCRGFTNLHSRGKGCPRR